MDELFTDDDEFTGDTGTPTAAGDSQTTLGDIQTQVQHQDITSGHQQTQAIAAPTDTTVSTVTNHSMSQTSTNTQPSSGTTARDRKSLFKHSQLYLI